MDASVQRLSHVVKQHAGTTEHTVAQQEALSQPGPPCTTKQLPLPTSPQVEHAGFTALGVSLLLLPAEVGSKYPIFQEPCGEQR